MEPVGLNAVILIRTYIRKSMTFVWQVLLGSKCVWAGFCAIRAKLDFGFSVTCYLPPATCSLLLATCYLPPAACNLQPPTCYLLPAPCYLPPAACNLLSATCNLQPATCCTCYLLPAMPSKCKGALCQQAMERGGDCNRARKEYSNMCPACYHHENGTRSEERR